MKDYLLRMDIDGPRSKSPTLVGLHVSGFGWVVGGGKSGELSIAVGVDGSWKPCEQNRNSQEEIDRFRRKFERFDYHKNGHENWPTL